MSSAAQTSNGVAEATASSWRAGLRPRTFRVEIVSGLLVALALIPEAISFALIAGVDPRVGLFTSVTMAIGIAVMGGRPAMISASTAAVALVVAPLSLDHGVDYLLLAVLIGGVLQILLGLAGIARLMRFIPRSVMVGFVNALAILMVMSQLPHLTASGWPVIALVLCGLGIIALMPRLTRVVPAPLIAIVVLTVVVIATGIDVPTVGDEGAMPEGLPGLTIPHVPWSLETLRIVLPYAIAMAFVGLLESLLTAKLLDDVTDTHSNKNREACGQGGANILTALLGGMGGCAVVGQSMMNVKAGGARTRVSTLAAGVILLILILVLSDVVARIPMAALVAVMLYVSWVTFDRRSVLPSTLRRMPRSETAVMLTTVAVVVATHNLAYGVVAGVLLASVLFARRVAHLAEVAGGPIEDGVRRYRVAGQLFFASSNDLYSQFDYAGDPPRVVIDLSDARVWDASTVAALDAVEHKYAAHGVSVEITGLDAQSEALHRRMSGHLGGE